MSLECDKALDITHKSPTAEPVFIVGMNGSGTSMLLRCLGRHPELYRFPEETKLLPYFIRSLPKYGDLNNDKNYLRLWNDLKNIFAFRKVNKGLPPPLPAEWRDVPRDFGSIVDKIFRYFASTEGKIRWCEKTPMHALHIHTLASVFPDARFLHIIRDGRDCAASFHRRWGYKPERTIFRWKNVVREARRQGASLGGRYFEIRYEELTRAPEPAMRRICTFLDVSFDDMMLRPSRSGSRDVHSESKVIVPNYGKWRIYFHERQMYRLEKIAGQMLAELNYPTDYPSSDFDPPRLFIKFWTYKDDIGVLFRLYAKILKKPNIRHKILISSRILSFIRQRITTKF